MKIDKWFHLCGRKDDVIFEEVPSIQRGGKWINENDGFATCSICGTKWYNGFLTLEVWNYCPNCGTRMEKEGYEVSIPKDK